jgi:hypothetical protein
MDIARIFSGGSLITSYKMYAKNVYFKAQKAGGGKWPPLPLPLEMSTLPVYVATKQDQIV